MSFYKQFSDWVTASVPFVFLIDFEQKNPLIYTFEDAANEGLYFHVKGLTNAPKRSNSPKPIFEVVTPVSKEIYKKAFQTVKHQIGHGNSFLLNLTFPSLVKTQHDLLDFFYACNAPYKLYKKGAFVVFSPECFIKIENDILSTYPMKGTIDARIPNAKNLLKNNLKEQYEHNTIVDLLRNDLSQVAKKVRLNRFRYLDNIRTSKGPIYQSSSEIQGLLPSNWKQTSGEIIKKLLPAGSVSGAPKNKTMELIQSVELDERGYYTGVFGVFDGSRLESGVNIRFLEQREGNYYYRSGGGITHLSTLEEEYHELINKIYVPIV